MKKLFLIALACIMPITNADAFLPLPALLPDAQPGGHMVAAMRAQQELKRQYLENQLLAQQIDMMRQQQATIEMQSNESAMQQNQVYDATDKNTRLTNYNDKKISESLENNAVGQSANWWDPNTGIKYTITPTKNISFKGNQYCREYKVIIQANKKKQQINNLACRLKNQSWIRIEKR